MSCGWPCARACCKRAKGLCDSPTTGHRVGRDGSPVPGRTAAIDRDGHPGRRHTLRPTGCASRLSARDVRQGASQGVPRHRDSPAGTDLSRRHAVLRDAWWPAPGLDPVRRRQPPSLRSNSSSRVPSPPIGAGYGVYRSATGHDLEACTDGTSWFSDARAFANVHQSHPCQRTSVNSRPAAKRKPKIALLCRASQSGR